MVEEFLKKHRDAPMKVSEIKEKIPKKVMHQTLLQIFNYLQLSGKILIGTKGILWIFTEEIQLLKSIKQKRDFIKENPFYGDNIPKNLIPRDYDVQNLWRAELSGYWRMLYTIKGDQIEVICFVLDILDHPSYNKLLGYKKK